MEHTHGKNEKSAVNYFLFRFAYYTKTSNIVLCKGDKRNPRILNIFGHDNFIILYFLPHIPVAHLALAEESGECKALF